MSSAFGKHEARMGLTSRRESQRPDPHGLRCDIDPRRDSAGRTRWGDVGVGPYGMPEGSRSDRTAKVFPTAGAVGDREAMTPVPTKDPAAVALGRKGGLKGGKARAAKLSPEQRSEIARKAAQARWQQSQ